MATNKNLHQARKAKNDEFYTQFCDISSEINTSTHQYRHHFENKVIYLNCDDETSEFWKFFKQRFNAYKLKKLVATHYTGEERSYKLEFDGQTETQTDLIGDGDFRSTECLEILQSSDIVVTNPPFSLFDDFILTLLKFNKHFIVLGNQMACSYSMLFPLIHAGKIWLGYNCGGMDFYVPENSGKTNVHVNEEGKLVASMGNMAWFTNLEIPRIHEKLKLGWSYYKNPEKYPKFDNYDAINIDAVKEIPYDYDGVMGVPISFLNVHCIDQFEIVNANDYRIDKSRHYSEMLIRHGEGRISKRERITFTRLLIRRKCSD